MLGGQQAQIGLARVAWWAAGTDRVYAKGIVVGSLAYMHHQPSGVIPALGSLYGSGYGLVAGCSEENASKVQGLVAVAAET